MRECPHCERCFEDEVLVCPDDQAKTKNTLPGTTLLNGRYRFEKRLGRGAMGQVYLARDENLSTRRVVVKTIRPDVLFGENLQEGEASARFERDARTAASIQHPNVVSVTDFGKGDNGVFFLVMEYVQGESLAHLLRREGWVAMPRAIRLLRQASAGIEAAHAEGVLHGNLTPANIFIVQGKKGDTGYELVKVADFGLTRIVSQSFVSDPGSHGIIGNPEYMAPEQMQADTTPDVRADVYALGAITYHMLGGRPPFTGDILQVLTSKLTQEAPPLSRLSSDIPSNVEKSVMHALAKEVEARPQSVAAWFAEFQWTFNSHSERAAETFGREVAAPRGADRYADQPRPSIGSSSSAPEVDSSVGSAMAAPASVIVTCRQCGARFGAGLRFCGRCGNPFSQPTRDREEVTTGELARPERERPSTMGSPPPMLGSPPSASSRPSLFERARDGVRSLLGEPRTSGGTAIPPSQAIVMSDEVRCSVFAPSYAKQGQHFLLQVFAHLPEQMEEAQNLATEFDATAQRRGLRTLEENIERGARLSFQLTAPGLVIAESVQSLIWRASPEPESVQFHVRVPADQLTEPIIGRVTVSHQTVPIGHITFKILIVARELETGDSPTRQERPWVPYKKAFISYASQDRKEVLKRVQMLDLEGIKFFQDALQMEPGQRWEQRLYREIDQCDVFYLFWSTAAKQSKWVMQEIHYALERKGNNESSPPAIIPVIIEGPPPVAPPPELAHLHFDHYMIYFMV